MPNHSHQKILTLITQQNITMKPKGYFKLRTVLSLCILIAILVFVGFFVSLSLYIVARGGYHSLAYTDLMTIRFVFLQVPFEWLGLSLVLLFLALSVFGHIGDNYQKSFKHKVLLLGFVSLVACLLFIVCKLNNRLENKKFTLPLYSRLHTGLVGDTSLLGQVRAVSQNGMVLGIKGQKYLVYYRFSDTGVYPKLKGRTVLVKGRFNGTKLFVADSVQLVFQNR